jgi:lysophospholipase L1-like esterase
VAGGSGGSGPAEARLSARVLSNDGVEGPTFGWSGSAIFAKFQGTGATLRMSGSPNQFAVVVDGKVGPVLKVSGKGAYPVATGLSAGTHDLVIWKRTEANQGSNAFLGLDITDGKLVANDPAPDRRIEIFGDSISAGYGLDGAGPNCPWSADVENHYLTYGAIAARELKAELHTVAQSGIGMYRGYGEDTPKGLAMPQIYARTLSEKAVDNWNFASWQPHAVVINLGTNDSNKGDPGEPYETAYLGFVRTLREKYPNTHFVLTIGPMLGGDSLTAIRTHLHNVIQKRAAEGDVKMSYVEFPTQTQDEGLGCDWHPGPKVNARMAKQLVDELKTRLNW